MEKEKEYLVFNGLKIDPLIFTQGFVAGCDVEICSGQCCNWGVYMDSEYKETIMKYEDVIKSVMDENQIRDTDKWFEKELEEDKDFPSGFAIGTELYTAPSGTEMCVFKDKNHYCTIQTAAVKLGKHKWEIKPTYCIMYPLTVIENVLTYDDDHAERLDYCGVNKTENFTQCVFEAMEEEIRFIFGRDLYLFLKDHYNKNYARKYQIDFRHVHKENKR